MEYLQLRDAEAGVDQADIRWPAIPQRNFSTIGPLTNTFGIFWDAFASSIATGYGGGTAKRHTLQYAVRETAKLKVDNFSFSTSEII